MSSNSVCNHTRDKQIRRDRQNLFITDSYDYRPNGTPPIPITIQFNWTRDQLLQLSSSVLTSSKFESCSRDFNRNWEYCLLN